jgi:FkbM family methyltransferase
VAHPVGVLNRSRSLARRLARASAARLGRVLRGPDRLGVPRELVRETRFFLAGRRGPTVEVRWPSGRYALATADMDVSRRTYVSGPYGLERLLLAAKLIEAETGRGIRGREVLEIGANIGTTTVPLATVLGAARVHAFEPMPRNLELLARNVALNDLGDRVAIHPEAVSDGAGTVTLTIPDRFWGSSRVVDGAGAQTHTARCVTVNALIADGTLEAAEFALVWIDVEGHEAAVLAGASRLAPTPVVLEYDPAQHADIAKLHELIRDAQLYDLSSGLPIVLERLEGDADGRPTDLLVIPQPCRLVRAAPAAQ